VTFRREETNQEKAEHADFIGEVVNEKEKTDSETAQLLTYKLAENVCMLS
jgi:hypothetical protein